MFITVKQASEKWGISDRRIRVLCSEGKIPGAYQEGRGWKIPVDALADKKEDRGVYRRVPVHIMGAQHEPVQPHLIEPKMEQLLRDFAESTEHIVTKLARFHIEFEGIHPFIDDNGRTGRLLVSE